MMYTQVSVGTYKRAQGILSFRPRIAMYTQMSLDTVHRIPMYTEGHIIGGSQSSLPRMDVHTDRPGQTGARIPLSMETRQAEHLTLL
jgi:hypothetical protein